MKTLLVLTVVFVLVIALFGGWTENAEVRVASAGPNSSTAPGQGGEKALELAARMFGDAASFLAVFAEWETEMLSKAVSGAPRGIQTFFGFLLCLREILIGVGLYTLLALKKGLGRLSG